MKTCAAPACNLPVFSHLFCQRHQYLRTDDKAKKRFIKKRSASRQDEETEYRRVCDEIDDEAIANNERNCLFCDKRIEDDEWMGKDHHHQFGRTGKLLTDKLFIKIAHHSCHLDYHQKSVSLLWWWGDYLERIKSNERLFNKEMKRAEKEQYHETNRV